MEVYFVEKDFYAKEKFFKCDCGCGALCVDYDNPEDKEFYFSIFTLGFNRDYSWGHRLRHIWNILRHGHPYTDCIVLNKKTTKQLRDHLSKVLRE